LEDAPAADVALSRLRRFGCVDRDIVPVPLWADDSP